MLDLEPIKARLTAATPGPWLINDDHGLAVEDGSRNGPTGYGRWICGEINNNYERERNRANATFIAAAPEDIAALIAEVELARDAAAHFFHCGDCRENGDCEEGQQFAVWLGLIGE